MKLIAAAATILLTSASAYAADAIVYQEPAPVEVINTFSWTGGYVGLNAGYAWGKSA
ncbi:porin family protein, partial [Ochrobactrum sp. SFR4]|nr:porin family protein [Ochrobactrum sp. SFR4]